MLPPVPPVSGGSHTSLGKLAHPRSAPALSSRASTPAMPQAEAAFLSLLCQQTSPRAWQLLVSLRAFTGSSCQRAQDDQDHGAVVHVDGRAQGTSSRCLCLLGRHLANVSFRLDKTWAIGGAEQAVPGFGERLDRAWGPIVPLRGNELMSTRERRCQVINCN